MPMWLAEPSVHLPFFITYFHVMLCCLNNAFVCILWGAPQATWYKEVWLVSLFYKCRNWSLEIWRSLPKISSTNSANIHKYCGVLLYPREFSKWLFLASVNKPVSHLSTISSHLFCLHVSSAVSMKSVFSCLSCGIIWRIYLFKIFQSKASIGSELHHKHRVW